MEVEQDLVLFCVQPRSDPMQLRPIRKGVRQDPMLLPERPLLVLLGGTDADKGTKRGHVHI